MKAVAITDTGLKRSINQDYVFCRDTKVGNLPNLFVVADGMGGHKAGDLASRFTVDTLVSEIEKSDSDNPISVIGDAIKTTNTKLIAKAAESEDYAGMGTTLVVACVVDNSMYVANIGDSRLYVIDNQIRQITRDHSYVEEMVSLGKMSRDAKEYSAKKNIITRAMGASDRVIPDFFEVDICDDDVILMCSDGLTKMVDDEEIKDIIKMPEGIKHKAEMLVDEANNNGGRDNIAIIIIEPNIDEVSLC